jgi:hypothetical protein
MFRRICLSFVLLVAMPAGSQVSTTDGGIGLAMTDQMRTPPPVNGDAYPTTGGSETRSNYLRAGLIFTTAYTDNVLGKLFTPVSDVVFSVFPTIAVDKTTSRLDLMLAYSPGFTIYQPTSIRNQTNQNLALNFQYRLSPHVTVTLGDSLIRTSDIFNQPNSLSAGAISGSPQAPLFAVIAPVGDLLSNRANAELTYQFSRNGMIGASGAFTKLNYPNGTSAQLYDSSSSGGSAFYSHRLSKNDYIGATYQYSIIQAYSAYAPLAYPVNAQTKIQTHTFFSFYTIYLKPTLSLSFSGGPQYFEVDQLPLPAYTSLSPTLGASMGWQGRHTSFAASYSRLVTGGGGLYGAFQSNSASAFVSGQFARTWSVGLVTSYVNNKDVTPSSYYSINRGHNLYGTVSIHHQLSEHLNMEFGYTHMHQTYSQITAITNTPNTNRAFISFSYGFTRPLGR